MFIRQSSRLFRILNSSSINAVGDKEPITRENIEQKSATLSALSSYFSSLEILTKSNVRTPVIRTQKKTAIVEIVGLTQSCIDLARELLDRSPDGHLCTRNLQQDPLEHFFGVIRGRNGYNDNPSPTQFKYALRKIIAIRKGYRMVNLYLSFYTYSKLIYNKLIKGPIFILKLCRIR